MFNLAQFFHDGGDLMWVNVFVMVFALAVVAERLFVLLFRMRFNDKKFVIAIEKLVMAGNIDRAIKLCLANDGPPVPRVVRSALVSARLGAGPVAAAIDESMMEVMPNITKRAGILWAIANLATLVGLVGTVFGLIQSFAAIGIAAPDQKSIMLTQGIAHAMSNTAFGLSIAVTCVFFHMILSLLTKNTMTSVELSAVRVENILARRRMEMGGRDAAAPAQPVQA